MNEPANDDRMMLPGHFPTWPGVLAALLVGGALAGADRLGLFPAALGGVAGRGMIAAHALVALALVTLLGHAARITGLRRELAVCRELPDDQRSGWPVEAFRDSLKRLYKRQSSGETRAEIARTASHILKRQQGTWQLALLIAYLVPTIGFAMTLWGLQVHGNSVPWRQVGLPLMVGLVESIPVLLLAIGVRKAARETASDWQRFAEELAIERRTGAARNETRAPDDDANAGATLLVEEKQTETTLPKTERKEPVAAKGLKKESPEAMKKDPAPPRV
jgi:hypothetical protein